MSAPHILVIDDEPDIRRLVKEILEDEGYRVAVADSARSARASAAEQVPDLVLLDIWMPGEDGISLLKDWRNKQALAFPVVMMSGHGTVETAVEATRNGAFDFVEKPLSLAKLLMVVEKALAEASNDAQYEGASDAVADEVLVGRSDYIHNLRQQAERLAESDASVLIGGEPATGKSTVLRQIHQRSARTSAPFITVRCATLKRENADEALFGTEQSGTVQRGILEAANTGVLHLSEPAALTRSTQAKLLDAIKNKSFTRLGGTRIVQFDVRVMTSSTVDLQPLVANGEFDEALYYKISVVPLSTLGLRDHTEDIPDMLEYYADWFVANEGLAYRHFNVAAQNRLRNCEWPGNVRELKNLVQRLLIMGSGVEVTLEEVEAALAESEPLPTATDGLMEVPLHLSLREARAEFERTYLQQQLVVSEGSMGELAKRTGMERTHLYRKLRSLGIETSKSRS